MVRVKAKVDMIEFSGVKFRRYPDSRNWADRYYYVPGFKFRKQGVGRLHQEVWKGANGPIPDGCEVHHKDRNPLNNSLENLECITSEEHDARHAAMGRKMTPEMLAHLDRIRPLASVWHGSEDGKAWHRQHGKKSWQNRTAKELLCKHCGKSYETRHHPGGSQYCSNRCRSYARRDSGVDNEQRQCERCGSGFVCNRYIPKRCCTKACAAELRWDERRSKAS